jgi:hypothetical protein
MEILLYGSLLKHGEENRRVKLRLVLEDMSWNSSLQSYRNVGPNYEGSEYLIFAGNFLHSASNGIKFVPAGSYSAEIILLHVTSK